MRRLVVRPLLIAAALLAAVPDARAQGMTACTDLPVTTLLAMADPDASHAASVTLHAVGTAPGCRPLGIGQPPPLGSIVPPMIELLPVSGEDLTAAGDAVLSNPVVGLAVAASGAAAWVAAGAGVTSAALEPPSDALVDQAVAPSVILNPEPATLTLFASGIAALGIALRRRLRV